MMRVALAFSNVVFAFAAFALVEFAFVEFAGAAPAADVRIPSAEAKAYFEKGVRLFAQEEYGEAAKVLEKAVNEAPAESDYHLWLGRAVGRRAELMSKWKWWTALSLAKKTRVEFERAVELDGTNEAALSDMLSFYTEAPGLVGGGLDHAEKIADRIAQLKPVPGKDGSAEGEKAWAIIDEKRGDFDGAEARLRKAHALEPDEVGHILTLASFLALRGWFDESDQLYAEALEREPDLPAVWFSFAKALVRAGRKPAEARPLLNRYIEADLEPDATPRWEARNLLKEL